MTHDENGNLDMIVDSDFYLERILLSFGSFSL